MTPNEFSNRLRITAKAIENYSDNQFPTVAGNIALRFVNGNFRAQGFQGSGFNKWKKSKGGKGTTLVDSGVLRAATYFTTQIGQATLRNNAPYAKVNNEGFKGIVSVKAHSRNRMGKAKVGTGRFTKTGKERMTTKTFKIGQMSVKAHVRNVDIPQRQFIPIHENDSPILNRAIQREVTRDLQQIITQ